MCDSHHPAEDWKAVNEELQKSCRYVIKNQTTGDRLKIRVVAVNAGGPSPPVALPEAVLVKEVAGRKQKKGNEDCDTYMSTKNTVLSDTARNNTVLNMHTNKGETKTID